MKIDTNYIATSHMLARELLNKEDSFITVMCENKEYIIDSVKRIAVHANIDDSTIHLALKLKEYSGGNIIR